MEVPNRLEAFYTGRCEKFTHAQILSTRHVKLCRKDLHALNFRNVIVISVSLLDCLVSVRISHCSLSPGIIRKEV
jgi:hypothetical protein